MESLVYWTTSNDSDKYWPGASLSRSSAVEASNWISDHLVRDGVGRIYRFILTGLVLGEFSKTFQV